ncbi:MAG: hypothetical protein L6Q92_09225 [Phycisphaerae bacterium]|nr:hypothetical protein [Phycisphaerae bacterium]
MHDHDVAVELLVNGVTEGVVRGSYAQHACQSRIDWINPIEDRGIVDLNTTEANQVIAKELGLNRPTLLASRCPRPGAVAHERAAHLEGARPSAA